MRFNPTLAKEGETAVATARSFPMDEPAAGPLNARGAERGGPSSTNEPSPIWPVLARIADAARNDETAARSGAQPASPSYRVDPPHDYAGSPSPAIPATTVKPTNRPATRPLPATKPVTARPHPNADKSRLETDNFDEREERDERVLKSTPLPIRYTMQALRFSEPYQPVIRFAAMLALMIVGGMSLTIMLNKKLAPANPQSSTTTAVVEPTATLETDPEHADFNSEIRSALTPERDTTSTTPTATGPLAPPSAPLMAIESSVAPATPVYPTTDYPQTELSKIVDDSPPRVQTGEPAVAKLQGSLEETKPR